MRLIMIDKYLSRGQHRAELRLIEIDREREIAIDIYILISIYLELLPK